MHKFNLYEVDIDDFDLLDQQEIPMKLTSFSPSIILNCGAYTAVDKAEDNRRLAERINADSVGVISNWCAENSCRLIHISTDFVFNGIKKTPYSPSDKAIPLGVYGRTKLQGEKHILRELPDSGVIVRTSWLYSEFRNNFVKTMLDLMNKKTELNVVADQIGSPTSTYSLSRVLMSLIQREDLSGVYHWCDGASISWHEFAEQIKSCAIRQGNLNLNCKLRPVQTSDYPTKAQRPKYSVLDRSAIMDHLQIDKTEWQSELYKVISKIENVD